MRPPAASEREGKISIADGNPALKGLGYGKRVAESAASGVAILT
jgi:hypothetical protein